MITASCHCGAVQLKVARTPRTLTTCNCSICRRYGALWAYYSATSVRVVCPPRALDRYSWGSKFLNFVRCKTCGCTMYHERRRKRPGGRMGVNARNFEPSIIANARVRRLDGAATWKYLD